MDLPADASANLSAARDDIRSLLGPDTPVGVVVSHAHANRLSLEHLYGLDARCLLRFCEKHDIEASAVFRAKNRQMSLVFMDRVAKPRQEPDAAAAASVSYEPYAADDRARLREIVDAVALVSPRPRPRCQRPKAKGPAHPALSHG